MNWKTYVEKKNAKTYVLPPGCDSRETVAAQLDCSPDKVDDHLRPALKSGEVIKQQYKVWDGTQKRLVFVTTYRVAEKVVSKAADSGDPAIKTIQKMKADGKSYAEIGAAIGKSGPAVRALLRRSRE